MLTNIEWTNNKIFENEKNDLLQSNESPIKNAKIETTALWVDILNSDISAGQLFEAEAKWTNVMSKFARKIDDNNYSIDFWTNSNLEHNIGLSEVMPENVKKVHIIWEKNWRKYDMIWFRQGTKGWFYDENGKYLPIFNGFTVKILESYTSEELAGIKKENDEKIANLISDPKFSDFRSQFWENELVSIVKKWVEYWIDPLLLMSFRKTENWWSWKQFWVMNPSIDTFDWQLNILCRIIQTNVNSYKRVTSENPIEANNEFSWDFIAYLSNIYAPIWASNDPDNLNKNHFTNLISFYSKYTWKDFWDTNDIIARLNENKTKWETAFDNDVLEWTTTPEDLIAYSTRHLWKKYLLWWSGNNSIDCSQLVIESMKDAWVIWWWFDTTAHNLARFTKQKNPNEVEKWDLVFLANPDWHITHVEIATWSIENWKIPIIDASSNAWKVSYREQKLNQKVIVWTPIFYS